MKSLVFQFMILNRKVNSIYSSLIVISFDSTRKFLCIVPFIHYICKKGKHLFVNGNEDFRRERPILYLFYTKTRIRIYVWLSLSIFVKLYEVLSSTNTVFKLILILKWAF